MEFSKIKTYLMDNAFTLKGSVKPNYLDGVPVIKNTVKETLHFLPDNTRQSDYIKAFINDLDKFDNIVNDYYNDGMGVKDIIKKTKLRKDIVYASLKFHGVISGFKLVYIEPRHNNDIICLYNDGNSIYDIAKKYNSSVTPVLRILKENNVVIRDNKKNIDNDMVLSLYSNKNNSIDYISKKMDCSTTVIRRVLKENSINISNHLLCKSILNEAITEYVSSGVSAVYIANKYNISSSIIYQEMEKRGIERRSSASYSTTNIEQLIEDILISCGVEYVKNDRKHIHPYEIDFYIPEYKLGIECNGLYWHSCHMRDKYYHKNKFELCDKNGIQLLQFWSNDIIEKLDIIKSMIVNKVKQSQTIYARKCKIGIVDGTTTRQFMINNHIQGYASSSINIGLYYGDELVMMLTSGKSRFGKDTNEIIRVATLLNFNVVGGFSRLLKNTIKVMDGDNIMSYCNLLYGNGNVYEKNGFDRVSDTSIGYFYHKKEIITSRYKVQSEKFKESISYDSTVNEYDNMLNNGYFRCFDTGNRKFILKL